MICSLLTEELSGVVKLLSCCRKPGNILRSEGVARLMSSSGLMNGEADLEFRFRLISSLRTLAWFQNRIPLHTCTHAIQFSERRNPGMPVASKLFDLFGFHSLHEQVLNAILAIPRIILLKRYRCREVLVCFELSLCFVMQVAFGCNMGEKVGHV